MSEQTPKNVSKVPAITPELLEKNEEEQKLWREQFRAVHPSADQYANLVIKDNLNLLDSLTVQLTTCEQGREAEILQKIGEIREDTAIWMSSVGQFEGALFLTRSPEQKDLFRKYVEAIDLPDDAWCEHPVFEHVDGQLSQVAYREFDFFSDSHAKKVSMVRCRTCGFRNAKDLNAELQKLSDHRAAVTASGKDVKTTIAEIVNG